MNNGPTQDSIPFGTGTSPTINITRTTTPIMDTFSRDSNGFKTAKITFYVIILLCSTFGNGMLVYIICSTRKMRTATNYLILNLAICDFFTPIFSIPFDFALEENRHKWFYGGFMCKFLYPAATFTVTSSALNLAVISLDRYRNIMHPYKPRLTQRQILCSIVGIHCFSVVCVAPYSYVLRLKGEECREVWEQFAHRQTYTLFLFLVQYALPLGFMAIMYTLALFNLYHSSGRTQRMRSQRTQQGANVPNGSSCTSCEEDTRKKPRPLLRSLSFRTSSLIRAHTKANKRATKMFLTVVIVFTIFMLPNQVVWLWSDFGGGHTSHSFEKTVIICWLFTYANCVSNPAIFAIFSNDFRYGFLKIFNKSFKFRFESSSSRRNSRMTQQISNNNNANARILIAELVHADTASQSRKTML